MNQSEATIAALARGNKGDRARAMFLRYLLEHPGLIVSDCVHLHKEVQMMVGSDGGCMWYCAGCSGFSSPNRPCVCVEQDGAAEAGDG
ncbi:MAG: hypothetical protein AAB633_00255 [Patescibacteria group bacterium]